MPSPTATKALISKFLWMLSTAIDTSKRFKYFNNFPLPPAASTALTTDTQFLTDGTGTEVVAMSLRGGVNLKTQATTPATGDYVALVPTTTCLVNKCLGSARSPTWRARVCLSQITLQAFSCGMIQTANARLSPDPTVETADGVRFIHDPTNAYSSGKNTANWLICTTVNSVETWYDTGMLAVAATDVEFAIRVDDQRIPHYLINGLEVYAGPQLQDAKLFIPQAVVKVIDAGTPVQHDFDIRFVEVTAIYHATL